MISGLDLNATIDYTLKDDKENPTVWKLGVIPSYLFAQISSSADKKEIETLQGLNNELGTLIELYKNRPNLSSQVWTPCQSQLGQEQGARGRVPDPGS
jgi:hypothetical protein